MTYLLLYTLHSTLTLLISLQPLAMISRIWTLHCLDAYNFALPVSVASGGRGVAGRGRLSGDHVSDVGGDDVESTH